MQIHPEVGKFFESVGVRSQLLESLFFCFISALHTDWCSCVSCSGIFIFVCVTIRKTVWIECGFARGQIIVIISPYEFESLNGATNEIIKLLVQLKLTGCVERLNCLKQPLTRSNLDFGGTSL